MPPASRVPLDDIKTAALSQIESLAPRLLPDGKRAGNWWVARCPWRDDRRASLHLSLTTTYYRDWGDGGAGGTILDLIMRLDSCSLQVAADTLADMLSLASPEPGSERPVRPEPPNCATCRHLWVRWPGARHAHCTAVTVPMLQEPMHAAHARRSGQACGPLGKLHVPMERGE